MVNACIRWVAWIGGMMVVGPSMPGDNSDGDAPPDEALLLGWHSAEREAQAEANREGVRLSQRRKSHARATEVPYCRPGPSYRQGDEGISYSQNLYPTDQQTYITRDSSYITDSVIALRICNA